MAANVSPDPPNRLRWAPEIEVRFVDVAGVRLRYIAAGSGPALLLLHTLRTQLDIFEHMVPLLAKHFSVYAMDYPGHGYSDAPSGRYDASFFTAAVEGFLERLELRDVMLAGVSIGGVIPLVLAARGNARIARIISINPYDYGAGLGLARSSLFGWIVTHAARIPVMGEIIIPLAPRWLIRQVLLGGVADAHHLPDELATEIHRVAKRPGQARAFINLLRNGRSWQDAQSNYAAVAKPVLLIWSDQDWSHPAERARTASLIGGVKLESIQRGGHFLSLDKPDELSRLIIEFAIGHRA